MMRTLMVLLLFFSVQSSFAQNKSFEKFNREMINYTLDNTPRPIADSLMNWDEYEIKWVHILGTYGGSPYCCGGDYIRINDESDLVLYDVDEHDPLTPWRKEVTGSIEMIGHKYVVQTFDYPEPQPTSNFHYVYVTRYFERKQQ